MDAGPVLLRGGVFLTGGRTRGCKAIGWVVGRSNPTESLRTKIAAANFKLKARLSCELLLSSKSGRLAIVTNKVLYFLTCPLASNCFR